MSVAHLGIQRSRKIAGVEKLLWTDFQQGVINKTYKKVLNSSSIKVDDQSYLDYDLVLKALDNGHNKLAKFLIRKGLRVYKNGISSQICERTILHTAVPFYDTDLIISILEKGAAPNILSSDLENKTPLHLAINLYKFSVVEIFLSHFDVKRFEEQYYLHYAIEKNIIPVVLMLIAKDFSITKKNRKNSTPFCIAIENKRWQILDILLSSYDVESIKSKKLNDTAPVYIASICGNLKFIKKYVNFGLPINIPLKFTAADSWSCLEGYCGFTILHCAVKHLQFEVIEFLLSKGADISVKNKNNSTPLHMAFEARQTKFWDTWKDFEINEKIINLILKANTKYKSNPVNTYGLSHFHIACSRDDPLVVEQFLKLGAFIDKPVKPQCPYYKGFFPLHFSAQYRCKKTLEILLKNSADVKKIDSQQLTALHIAAKGFCLDTIKLLLQYGAEVTATDVDKNTPIHWAFENRNYKIIDLLLSAPNVTDSNPENKYGVSHFHIACSRNNVKVVKSFITNGVNLDARIPMRSPDWKGYSPLHLAVAHNKPKIVQLLLNEGARINVKDIFGHTPLHTACQYTSTMFMEFIKINVLNASKKYGKISLYLKPVMTDDVYVGEDHSKSNGYYGSIEKIDWSYNRIEHMENINFLMNYGSDVNCIDCNHNTSLFYAYSGVTEFKKDNLMNNQDCSRELWSQIVESLNEELHERRKLIVRYLLKFGANLEKCSLSGSILHYICNVPYEEHDHMMEYFLKNGADVNAKDKQDKQTPLHHAVSFLKTELVGMLLDYGANVDCINPKDNSTPLLIVTSIIELLKIEPYSDEIVKMLINKGANPNARLCNGNTALHNLARVGGPYLYSCRALTIMLIEAGADINSQDSSGLTVLHRACKYHNVFMFHLLLRYGADINVEDDKGRSVFCYLHKKYLESFAFDDSFSLELLIFMVSLMQHHIITMHAIGFQVGSKTLLTNSKIAKYELLYEMDEKLPEDCQTECQTQIEQLRNTKIHSNCTLYDVLFKNENELSHLVQNRNFMKIVQSKSFEEKYYIYCNIVQSKYRTGVARARLLPVAKRLLNNLAKLHLPDVCSENICKYFTNTELDESIRHLIPLFNSKIENSDNKRQLRIRRTIKLPKLC